ncbi:hypothetical protein QZH41_015430, partial [Actinostola sp. cb2023]
SVRKSLQGLDYFAAEGARAFDDLVVLVRQIGECGMGKEWETRMIEVLKTAKLYLKGDYKVHIARSSQVADHCMLFSLSDSSDTDYVQVCNHTHPDTCEQCQDLVSTLSEIENATNEANLSTQDDAEEGAYLFKSAKLAIHNWKCHILRSSNQDQARFDVLEVLDQETVLIINAWAMKFLPQRYRESQADWFGKRGISWHISVVYRCLNGVLQWQGFIHAIQSCSQGSSAVVRIVQDVLTTLKSEYSEITKAYIRQDNAGCYHSSATILACPDITRSTGITISRVDFCDPQGGKGAADRLAATCKAHIRTYINEGNDVVTAQDLKQALLSHGGINGVRVVSMDFIDDATTEEEQTAKIPSINKLNNFAFVHNTITVWRAYNIGTGKEIKLDKLSYPGRWYRFGVSTFIYRRV